MKDIHQLFLNQLAIETIFSMYVLQSNLLLFFFFLQGLAYTNEMRYDIHDSLHVSIHSSVESCIQVSNISFPTKWQPWVSSRMIKLVIILWNYSIPQKVSFAVDIFFPLKDEQKQSLRQENEDPTSFAASPLFIKTLFFFGFLMSRVQNKQMGLRVLPLLLSFLVFFLLHTPTLAVKKVCTIIKS